MKFLASLIAVFRPMRDVVTVEQRRAQARERARALVAEIAAAPPRHRKAPDQGAPVNPC